MRIIAGKHRGRRLLGPVDRTTRPITDRVKTALFDRLAAADRLADARVADVFCGTGSMGLECLSRGAASVLFVDRDRSARQRLEQNLATLGEADRARLLSADAFAGGWLHHVPHDGFTLVFLDPPYRLLAEKAEAIFDLIARAAGACTPGAWLVLRTDRYAKAGPVVGWADPEPRPYGSMVLHVYQRRDGSSAPVG